MIQHAHKISLLACCALAMAGCDRKADSAPGKGVAMPDVSKVAGAAPDGLKIDAKTMRTRVIAGRWVGKSGEDRVEIFFGAGDTVSVQIKAKDNLVDAATGRYVWNQDGTLSGTTSGGGARLGSYAKWNAAFSDGGVLTFSGSGTSLTATRMRSQPVAGNGPAMIKP